MLLRNLVNIGPGNGLSTVWRQAIAAWTNANLLPSEQPGANLNQYAIVLIQVKMHLKMSPNFSGPSVIKMSNNFIPVLAGTVSIYVMLSFKRCSFLSGDIVPRAIWLLTVLYSLYETWVQMNVSSRLYEIICVMCPKYEYKPAFCNHKLRLRDG